DQLAVIIVKMLEQMGLSVPEDVQIIGFDGLMNFDETPYCSSIVQPVAKMAETAVDILLSEDRSKLPALTCLPVTYRPGGMTRDNEA
ncbi:MAG: substrate-binding domain-containing protein, partial [Lachnospiraceae bacterium]|nr:substrate-binding domain-containing protein [Lachnospiraceae bacterium]